MTTDSTLASDRSSAVRWIGLTVVVGTMIAGSGLFLPVQSLWSDETTQLNGVGLGPTRMVRWLAGGPGDDNGQFPDRMPPASYCLGWAWSRAFGAGEASLRWSGVACVALASALVYEAARKAFGVAAAWAAGLAFATSPRVVVISVEIRAYPLFLLLSAASFSLLVGLAGPDDRASDRPRRRARLAGLAVVLALAVQTHFYGIVLAGAILTSLAVMARARRWGPGPILAVFGVVGLAVLATVPFFRSALGKPGTVAPPGFAPIFERIYKLILNVVVHPTMMVDRPVETAALVGSAALAVLATRSRAPAARPIALALLAGLAAVTVGVMALSRDNFNPTAASYNLWIKPGLCVLLSAGLGVGSRAIRRVTVLATGLLIAAQGAGLVQLASHGRHFVHGPARAVTDLVRSLGPGQVAIVYDDPSPARESGPAARPSDAFKQVSGPIRYEFGPVLEQFQFEEVSKVGALDGNHRAGQAPRPVASLPHRYLVVVRAYPTGDLQLARQVRSGDRPIDPGPIARSIDEAAGRRLVHHELRVAAISARIDVYERPAR